MWLYFLICSFIFTKYKYKTIKKEKRKMKKKRKSILLYNPKIKSIKIQRMSIYFKGIKIHNTKQEEKIKRLQKEKREKDNERIKEIRKIEHENKLHQIRINNKLLKFKNVFIKRRKTKKINNNILR
jgi:hypothetical protein